MLCQNFVSLSTCPICPIRARCDNIPGQVGLLIKKAPPLSPSRVYKHCPLSRLDSILCSLIQYTVYSFQLAKFDTQSSQWLRLLSFLYVLLHLSPINTTQPANQYSTPCMATLPSWPRLRRRVLRLLVARPTSISSFHPSSLLSEVITNCQSESPRLSPRKS